MSLLIDFQRKVQSRKFKTPSLCCEELKVIISLAADENFNQNILAALQKLEVSFTRGLIDSLGVIGKSLQKLLEDHGVAGPKSDKDPTSEFLSQVRELGDRLENVTYGELPEITTALEQLAAVADEEEVFNFEGISTDFNSLAGVIDEGWFEDIDDLSKKFSHLISKHDLEI